MEMKLTETAEREVVSEALAGGICEGVWKVC